MPLGSDKILEIRTLFFEINAYLFKGFYRYVSPTKTGTAEFDVAAFIENEVDLKSKVRKQQ
jgi:hypothetical protein